MFHLPTGFLIIYFSWCLWGATQADIFEECAQKTNVYVASSQSCSKYIFCDGEESSLGECEQDTPYFSETDQTCDTQQSVCKEKDQTGSNGNPQTPSTTTAPQSSSITPTSTSTITSMNSASSAATAGSTTPIFTTLGSTTPGSNTPGSNTPVSSSPVSSTPVSTTPPIIVSSSGSPENSTGTVPTTPPDTHVVSQCPATDDHSEIVFLPHTTSCSNYFMCYHGEPMPMHCSNMLYFDPKSQKCDYPENVKCQLDSASPREKCQVHTIDSYPYPTNCNYYYLCSFGYLMVMQCPLNMDWDSEKKVCRQRGSAKCYHPAQYKMTM